MIKIHPNDKSCWKGLLFIWEDKFKLISDIDNSRKEYLESCFQYWKEMKKYISGKRTENMPYISNEVLDVVKEILYKDYYESVEEK